MDIFEIMRTIQQVSDHPELWFINQKNLIEINIDDISYVVNDELIVKVNKIEVGQKDTVDEIIEYVEGGLAYVDYIAAKK